MPNFSRGHVLGGGGGGGGFREERKGTEQAAEDVAHRQGPADAAVGQHS